MAVKINFYTFSKKENSTLQPTGSGTEYDCVFVEPCDMLSPTISLDYGTTSTPTAFNYCKIATFNRYYYITDWTYDSGLWYASLSVDALASWRTSIGSSEQYILRSTYLADGTTKVYNGNIADDEYPLIGTDSFETEYCTGGGWTTQWVGGSVVLGLAGYGYTGTHYIVLAAVEFMTFVKYLFTQQFRNIIDTGAQQAVYNSSLNVVELADVTVSKTVIDPFKYITSAMWFPQQIAKSSTISTTLQFGWASITANDVATATGETFSGWYDCSVDNFNRLDTQCEIPKHPQSASRGNYLNLTPYSDYTLFEPFFGTIHLDATKLLNQDTLYIRTYIDPISGEGRLLLSTEEPVAPYYEIDYYEEHFAQVGTPIQLNQISTSPLGIALGNLSSLGSIDYGAGLAGKVTTFLGNAFAKIGSLAAAAYSTPQTKGQNGSRVSLKDGDFITAHFINIAEEHFDHVGRPYCHARDVDDLSGYMVIGDAEIDFPCTPTEKETIVNYMEGGFFYE